MYSTNSTNNVCPDCGKPYCYVGDVFGDISQYICTCIRCPVCGQSLPCCPACGQRIPKYLKPYYPYDPWYTPWQPWSVTWNATRTWNKDWGTGYITFASART